VKATRGNLDIDIGAQIGSTIHLFASVPLSFILHGTLRAVLNALAAPLTAARTSGGAWGSKLPWCRCGAAPGRGHYSIAALMANELATKPKYLFAE
jgi:hypothetical protein